MKEDAIIPANNSGKKVDLYHEIIARTEDDAIVLFNLAQQRLLHPSTWKSVKGIFASSFKPDSNQLYQPVREGDYIQIDVPAPGLSAGDGHDWVKVEQLTHNIDTDADDSITLTVKVAENPNEPQKGVAHFFGEGASSTFIIRRNNVKVMASYHGRNESANMENPGLGDKIRNVVVAIGAMAGMSEVHWKGFLEGLLLQEQ